MAYPATSDTVKEWRDPSVDESKPVHWGQAVFPDTNAWDSPCAGVGYTPWKEGPDGGILWIMNIIILLVVLLLLFGGGGFYLGGPAIGGGAFGLILVVALVVYMMGGFRRRI